MLTEDLDNLETDEETRAPKRAYRRPQLPDGFERVPETPIERARRLEHEKEALTAELADLRAGLARQFALTEHERRRAEAAESVARMVCRCAFRA